MSKVVEFATSHVVFRLAVSWFAVAIFHAVGVITQAHFALAVLMMVDTFSGFAVAWQKGKVRSSKLFLGALRKVLLYGVFIITIHQVAIIQPALSILDEWSVLFLGATEALSVLENLSHLGIIIPAWLQEKLHKILDREPV